MNKTPIDTFLDEISRLDTFVEVALEGFGYSVHAESVTDFIRSSLLKGGGPPHPVSDDEIYKQRKKHARKLGDFSQAEETQGHPFLFSLAVVRLYSLVEAAVDAVFFTTVRERQEILNSEPFSRLKGPLVPFALATDDERAEILRDRLFQDSASINKIGIGRFEYLLNIIGQRSQVPETVRKVILELSEIRHVVVHRNGIVDGKFMRRCPWLELTLGAPFNVGHTAYRVYSLAITWYLMELGLRWQNNDNEDRESEARIVQRKLLSALEQRYIELRPNNSACEGGTTTTA